MCFVVAPVGAWGSCVWLGLSGTCQVPHSHRICPHTLCMPPQPSPKPPFLCAEVQIPEARAFYAFQAAIETVHSEMYGLLLETYIADASERHRLFRAIQTIPTVGRWLDDWSVDCGAVH